MAQMSVLLLSLLWLGAVVAGDGTYSLDDTPGLGRVFDGIGGLSGGGVSPFIISISFCCMKGAGLARSETV